MTMKLTENINFLNDPFARTSFHLELDTQYLDEPLDPEVYDVYFDVADPVIEDEGIGPYEYWGAKGNDVRLVVNWSILDIYCIKDVNGNQVTDPERVRAIVKRHWDQLSEYVDEHLDPDDYTQDDDCDPDDFDESDYDYSDNDRYYSPNDPNF